MRKILLVDGENFKSKIKEVFYSNNRQRPVWYEYDFKKLFEKTINEIDVNNIVFYFAKIKSHPATPKKSNALIQEQRMMKTHLEKLGFKFNFGGIVTGHVQTDIRQKETMVFKEKGVDVKIAVDMVICACDKIVDEIIVGSSDSDLIPAIREVRKRGLKCSYLVFEDKINKGILYSSDKVIIIRNMEVLECEKIQNSLPLNPK